MDNEKKLYLDDIIKDCTNSLPPCFLRHASKSEDFLDGLFGAFFVEEKQWQFVKPIFTNSEAIEAIWEELEAASPEAADNLVIAIFLLPFDWENHLETINRRASEEKEFVEQADIILEAKKQIDNMTIHASSHLNEAWDPFEARLRYERDDINAQKDGESMEYFINTFLANQSQKMNGEKGHQLYCMRNLAVTLYNIKIVNRTIIAEAINSLFSTEYVAGDVTNYTRKSISLLDKINDPSIPVAVSKHYTIGEEND